ncbi:radical SAM protein [Pseudodesulfovibrio cashew]|uniref:Radical SAM protein n=1 Tax=Pseudodesulfovibrio cashew TaxID=2678688 RepID=A0A6I6JDZ3_9BACT|nr:radical SAM protein [Pseudodesulfovibrio cashew]QGY38652.1 radical SAM protein [Pseudodesulfovibrio cashew]
MKVLLLTPPAPKLRNPATAEVDLLPPKTWVPLGIAYLAGALRMDGIEAHCYDLHSYTWMAAAELLEREQPDVVGISCFTLGRAHALRLATLARMVLPEARIVMGGPHATFFPGHMLRNKAVDVVALGEGEETIVELVRCFEQGGDVHRVRGLALRAGNSFVRTPPRKRGTVLNGLALPVYDTFDLSEYKSPEIPPQYQGLTGTHILTSRGCPFQCNFCSVHSFFDGRWASRSPLNVIGEIEMLMERFDVRHIYFSDDLFSLNRERVISLCREIIDRKLEFLWMAETRVDLVDEELLAWMRRAGCYRIYYGVESGSPRVLKTANKGFTPDQVRDAFRFTHQAGMEPCCFLMVGNPGETMDTIGETVELIRDIRPATMPILGINTILPASAQYSRAKELRLISDEYWLSDEAPPLYTAEHDVDDLIYMQMMLTKGIAPEVYAHMCEMGFDEKYFLMRRMARDFAART